MRLAAATAVTSTRQYAIAASYRSGLSCGGCTLALRGLLRDGIPLRASLARRLAERRKRDSGQWNRQQRSVLAPVYVRLAETRVKVELELTEGKLLLALAALGTSGRSGGGTVVMVNQMPTTSDLVARMQALVYAALEESRWSAPRR
ncbi:MAG: hypothetical protein MUD17_00145 [Gemmatimonadaceae bacterium]|nr:hypothetical protein [Gemmatimonadaceae bacterium]